VGLTGRERRHIIRLISEARHARLQALREASPRDHCAGCGTHYEYPNPGCQHCKQRESRRLKRERAAVPCKTPGCDHKINPETYATRYRGKHSGYCITCHHRRRREACTTGSGQDGSLDK